VRAVASQLGATLFEKPFGRARLDPWPHIPRDQSASGVVGIAILSRLPALLIGQLALGRIPGDPTPERGGLHVQVDVGGTPVEVVGVHLSSRLPYGPPVQLRRLAPQLPPPDRPAIVAGDCNFWGPGVVGFLSGTRPTVLAGGPEAGWRRAVRGRTWPASRPHSQIDHILVRGGIQPLRGEVLPDVGSDHRPVRARLRVR
jgi:endonuclease/exonuclease/phosphatase family metal-dependent hydrolase